MDAQTQLVQEEDGGFPPLHMRAPYAEGAILPLPEPLPRVANLRSEPASSAPRALQGASLAGAVIGGLFVGAYVLTFFVNLWRRR